eukprot:scaffold5855_cov117-Isochrysis_galbana.AAC.15
MSRREVEKGEGEFYKGPLLPKPLVITEVTRQSLQRVHEPRRADVGVARGDANRSARRCQLSAYI